MIIVHLAILGIATLGVVGQAGVVAILVVAALLGLKRLLEL